MEKIKPDSTYHIFNHANGFENVFQKDENFRFFLEKYRVYISPIAETYAYCLMPNHFHLVVRIRKQEIIEKLIRSSSNFYNANTNSTNSKFSNTSNTFNSNFSKVPNFGKVKEEEEEEDKKFISNETIEKYLSKQFSNLFSSYTQSFNKVYKRMGSLFIKNFKRELIIDKDHFLNTIMYTHRNPIHHGFCKKYSHWSYCSYSEIMDEKSNLIEINKLFKIVGGKEQFFRLHDKYLEKFINSIELET